MLQPAQVPSRHPRAPAHDVAMPDTRIVQIFCNPGSGSYSPRRIEALVQAFEALGADVRISDDVSTAPQIAGDATHICIVGGDGTVRHVASAVARGGHMQLLGIHPSGTVNLLAREAGQARTPQHFATQLLSEGAEYPHYPVAVGEEYFLACASAGPDSAAIARLSDRLKRWIGRYAYLAAFLGLLWRWPRPRIVIEADGVTHHCEAFYVAKGRYFAGQWSFAPRARVDDPLLHIVALQTARRRDFLWFAWSLLRGWDPAALPRVTAFTCKTLTAASDDAVPVQADGDIIATLPVKLILCETPIRFRKMMPEGL